jgi:heme oxygenase
MNLNYNGLAISEGGMAMNAFEQLQYVTDQDKIKETRKNLLEYCKMDTLAMVRILEELESM